MAAGADGLEVNVGAPGVDEVEWLPRAVRLVLETVDVTLSIDTADFEALGGAFRSQGAGAGRKATYPLSER